MRRIPPALAFQKCRRCGKGPGTLRLEGRYLFCSACNKTVAELDETETYEHRAEELFGDDVASIKR